MTPERPGYVMIFAVNVVGNCTTDGYIFCPGRNGEEISARHGEIEDLLQGDAGLAAEQSHRRIEMQQPVHAGSLEQRAVLEETHVTIAASEAHRQLRDRGSLGQRKVGGPMQRNHFRLQFWIPSPRFKLRTLLCLAA